MHVIYIIFTTSLFTGYDFLLPNEPEDSEFSLTFIDTELLKLRYKVLKPNKVSNEDNNGCGNGINASPEFNETKKQQVQMSKIFISSLNGVDRLLDGPPDASVAILYRT